MIHAQIAFHNVGLSAAAEGADIGVARLAGCPLERCAIFPKNQNFELDNSPFVWYNGYKGTKYRSVGAASIIGKLEALLSGGAWELNNRE